jgi:CcmD family protein
MRKGTREEGKGRRHPTNRLAVFVLPLLVAMGPVASLAQQPPPTPAQEGFVPVDQLQQKEQLPAAPLVMAAYAAAWIVIFLYVWFLWTRLAKVEREIMEVSRRLDAAAKPPARH